MRAPRLSQPPGADELPVVQEFELYLKGFCSLRLDDRFNGRALGLVSQFRVPSQVPCEDNFVEVDDFSFCCVLLWFLGRKPYRLSG